MLALALGFDVTAADSDQISRVERTQYKVVRLEGCASAKKLVALSECRHVARTEGGWRESQSIQATCFVDLRIACLERADAGGHFPSPINS